MPVAQLDTVTTTRDDKYIRKIRSDFSDAAEGKSCPKNGGHVVTEACHLSPWQNVGTITETQGYRTEGCRTPVVQFRECREEDMVVHSVSSCRQIK